LDTLQKLRRAVLIASAERSNLAGWDGSQIGRGLGIGGALLDWGASRLHVGAAVRSAGFRRSHRTLGGPPLFLFPTPGVARLSRLDRYVVREMFVPFLIGTLVVVLMFQANAYIFIAKNFNVENIPLSARFQWIMFQTPGYMRMTLPVGTSLAAALAMTRLTRESELTALRAAGARILRVIFPVVGFGVAVGIGNFYVVDRLVPIATRKADELERKNAYLGQSALMKSDSFLKLDQFAASLGTVLRDPKNDSLNISDIVLIERTTPTRTTIVTAKRGHYDKGIWDFTDANLYLFVGDDLWKMRPMGKFQIRQNLNLEQLFVDTNQSMSIEEEPTPQLIKQIHDDIAVKIDPKPAEVELSERYAVPASCAVFAITSSVFAIWFGRSGGFAGVLISFFVVLLYYNAFVISTQIIGKLDSIPPWTAAWLPNIAFGVIALILLRRLE
jgi:lipopolysaccharide export system permease protein